MLGGCSDLPVIPALRRQGQDRLSKLSRQTGQIEVLWVRVRACLHMKGAHTCTHRCVFFVSLGTCKLHASHYIAIQKAAQVGTHVSEWCTHICLPYPAMVSQACCHLLSLCPLHPCTLGHKNFSDSKSSPDSCPLSVLFPNKFGESDYWWASTSARHLSPRVAAASSQGGYRDSEVQVLWWDCAYNGTARTLDDCDIK